MTDLLTVASLLSIFQKPIEDPELTKKNLPNKSHTTTESNFKQRVSLKLSNTWQKTIRTCQRLTERPGTHSTIAMNTAGFKYTNQGDTARCDTCELEVSGWTLDMKPFVIHSQRSPTCSFVLSMTPTNKAAPSLTNNIAQTTSTSNNDKQAPTNMGSDKSVTPNQHTTLLEIATLKQVRKRTFSHWPHRSSPTSLQMIEAGFFNCNVGDRVICIYCNIICQQWTPNSDDPCEIHKALSPKCIYVTSILTRPQTASVLVINEHLTNDQTSASVNVDPFRSNAIVHTAACNTTYIEIPKRYASFANWPNENAPPVDDLVKAGFFFTGTKSIVTCFYCNGSLQNWGPNDNPIIEHARWFPHCAYAKQLCGVELHRKIQESKRAHQEKAKANDSNSLVATNGGSCTYGPLVITDENTLSRLVAARLDLSISQSLLQRGFKLSIIKRCWEDQLRLKREDFVSDSDLLMACTILQKQIEGIDGKKENIIVPSVAMRKIREKWQARDLSSNSSNSNDVEMITSSEESTSDSTTSIEAVKEKQSDNKLGKGDVSGQTGGNTSTPTNPCVLCLEEEKRLACIPCGHLATCVPCGHSLRSCPICRRGIDAFIRIYL